MGLIEALGLIIGTVAGAMALPFVMERLDRGLEDTAPRQRRRHRIPLPSFDRVHLHAPTPSHDRLPATRP